MHDSEGRKPKSKAYLVIQFRTEEEVPRFFSLGVFSSPAGSLTSQPHILNADIFHAEGDSFADAEERIFAMVRDTKSFQWMWKWLDPSREAHDARYLLFKKVAQDL